MDIFAYLAFIFLIIFANVSLYSSPISAIITIVYFVSNITKQSKHFKITSILLLVMNFTSILWTKVGIFLYELGMALSNESAKYYDFHNGLGKTLANVSYVLPFIVLIVYLCIKNQNKIEENATTTKN